MKALFFCASLLIATMFAGCATMAENRVESAALQSEVQDLLVRWQAKSESVRPLVIIGHNVTYPNYAEGVDLTLSFKNTSSKPIKYLHVAVTAINRVGDPAASSITGEPQALLTATGPFPPGYTTEPWVVWKNVWYNNTVAIARLDSIDVEFMDGTKQQIVGADLATAQLRPANNEFTSGIQQKRRVTLEGGRLRIQRLDL